MALLRQLPGRPGAAAASRDGVDLPVPLPARTAAASGPDEGGRTTGRDRPALPAAAGGRRRGVPRIDGRIAGRAQGRASADGRVGRDCRGRQPGRLRQSVRPRGAGLAEPGHHLVRVRDPPARRADGRPLGRLCDRARRLLGRGDGHHRLLPVLPGVAGPSTSASQRRQGVGAPVAARRPRFTGRHRAADPADHRSALDRSVGDEGADLRYPASDVDVEPGPGCLEQPDVEARRVAPPQPPAGRAVGDGRLPSAIVGTADRRRAQRGQRGHGYRGRGPGRAAAPDDRGSPRNRRRQRRLLRHRVRLRRAVRRTGPCTSTGTAARSSRRTGSTTTRCWRRSSPRASVSTRVAASACGRSGARH